jgi:hypothetical protein
MTGSWEGFGWQPVEIPQAQLDDELRARLDLPATLRPVLDAGAVQPAIFEPALKQHSRAYRAADPRFADERIGRAWYAARRTAMDLVLAAIANSPWVDALVLRGSVLLRAWFGDAAREPGDLDFVVVPASWLIEEQRTTDMLTGIAQAAECAGRHGATSVRFDAAEAISEDIWTYDRVPGRRLILPWTATDLPGGIVQLDFVFNERLPIDPEPALIPSASRNSTALLNAATAELSLAWKLMWLLSDTYPQGKDLYDAVLLSEHTSLRYNVLQEVFLDADPSEGTRPVGPDSIASLQTTVEWNHFVNEYPDIAASETEFVNRLVAALAPTFCAVEAPGESGYARHVRWLATRTETYRSLLERTNFQAVLKKMRSDGLPALAAIVIVRELLGSDRHSVEDARAEVFEDPAWVASADHYQRAPSWLDRDLEQL